MIYIKDMDMPADCLACRIRCKHESYRVTGRPEDCPLEEAKTGDLISRADAIRAVAEHFSFDDGCSNIYKDIDYYKGIAEHILKNVPSALPSAEQVTGKLKNPCDSLLKSDSYECKEQKSKLDLISRADAIEAVCEDCEWERKCHEECTHIETLKALQSAEAEPIMTEEVREALMRLTMCAREECGMCKYKDECGFDFQYKISTDNMQTLLDALSAEAVQGEWVDIDNYYRLATCSHCHKVTMFEKWGEYTKPYNFCPNCGARMKGGEQND